MSRTLRSAVVVALAVVVSGCMTVNQHVTVHSDGSTDISSELLVDNSFLTLGGETLDEALASMKSSLTPPETGTLTMIKGSKRSGFKITNHFKTLDTALYWMTQPNTGQSFFSKAAVEESGNWVRPSRTFTFVTKPQDTSADVAREDPSEESSLNSLVPSAIDLTLALTVPENISSATGDGKITDEGHTVTWDMPLDRAVTLEAQTSAGPPALFWVVIAAILVVLIGGGLGTFLFIRRRRLHGPAPARPPVTQG